jgi:hypothetical protein
VAVGLYPEELLKTIKEPNSFELGQIMASLKNNLGTIARLNVGPMRTSETIVIMDFDLYSQASNSRKYQTLQLKLTDKGWDKHRVFHIASGGREGYGDLRKIMQDVLEHIKNDKKVTGVATAHLLLTLREMAAFGPAGREYPGKMKSLPSQNMQAEIETHYLGPIRALQQVIARPLIISVCHTAKGCNAQGEIGQAARYVVSETRKMGCISTMGGAIWSRLIAARDQDSDKLNGALAEPAWACLERDIFFQKILANAAISGRSSSGDARNESDPEPH